MSTELDVAQERVRVLAAQRGELVRAARAPSAAGRPVTYSALVEITGLTRSRLRQIVGSPAGSDSEIKARP